MTNESRFTMKERPVCERPYEKCEAYGPGALSNCELLAVLLRSGTPGQSAVDTACALLKKFDGSHPLAEIFDAGIGELTEIAGVGKVKAITLECVGELARRISQETAAEAMYMSCPESVANYFMEKMRHLSHEEIWAAYFDTKSHFIQSARISAGTVNSSVITPRELYLSALKYKAVYIVLLHNHPSGDPSPSQEDIELTARLKEVGELMHVPIMDHIIIGDRTYVSLKDRGFL